MKDAGWNRGICVSLDANGGELAIAIARQSELSVYRIEPDAEAVRRTRSLAESAGLSPLRIRVEQGTLESAEYPDWCANVIVADAWSDDLMRILRPSGGIAFLKSDRGLPTDGIAAEKPSAGLVRVKRLALDGAGDWTHYQQTSANNRYSSDRLIRPPFGILWYGEPTTHRGAFWFVQGLAADGLLYLTDLSPTNPNRCVVTARDAYNGTVHWEREVGGDRFLWREPLKTDARGFTNQINTPGKIYEEQLAIFDGKIYAADNERCLIFDAATGKDVRSFAAPRPSAPENVWSYLAIDGDLLFGQTVPPYVIPEGNWPGAPMRADSGGPATLFALDPADGSPKWVRGGTADDELGTEFDTPLAIGDGRVFLRSGKTLFALDSATGKTVWSDAAIDEAGETWWEGAVHKNRLHLIRYDKRFYNRRQGAATLIFDARDGKRIAEEPLTRRSEKGPSSIADGLLCSPSGTNGCILDTAAGNVVFSRNGYSVFNPDRKSWGSGGGYDGARASCRVGAIPAGGVIHLLPNWGCTCRPFNATVTLYSTDRDDGDLVTTRGAVAEKQGDLPSAARIAAGADDWPTFRGNPARDAVTPQELARPLKKAWEAAITGAPTPPIAVGDMVYLGSTDERVRALDAATGAVRWEHYASGPIVASPVYWEGRIYFGAEDGWIHCVAAADGKPLWRIRVAPGVRKQGGFGRIVSSWPVQQGLAVADGKVWFTAGKVSGQGIVVGALDAADGRVLWTSTEVSGVPGWHIVLGSDRAFVPVEDRSGNLAQFALADGKPLDAQVALGYAAHISYVAGSKADGGGYARGFLVHGGGGVDRFTGQVKGGGFGMTPPWERVARDKFDEVSGEARAFFPVIGTSRIYFGQEGELVAAERSKLQQLLKGREARTASGRESLLAWQAKDLPCGKPEWMILAGDDARTEATLLAGGEKGVAAVDAASGRVLWNVPLDEATFTPAVSRGRVFLTTATGKALCLSPQ
ncbi:MAG: PQQ-binding-like beta-propeller repeat protein [Planctomycetaceae bacterium]